MKVRVKGHTTILLKDAKGKVVERHEDDNMLTNGIQSHLANCGFLNFPNVNQSQLVEELLGGLMAFDTAITEDATQVFAPAGLTMIANGAVGTQNSGEPSEMGSASSYEEETGWQQDGSYLMTFNWDLPQGIGTIASVCACGKAWGYAGEGNARSGASRSTKVVTNLPGTPTEYRITGIPCRISQSDSSCYGIEISDAITIRKYRLPLTKVNLKGQVNAPIVLSELTIEKPANLTGRYICYDTGETLAITSCNTGTSLWGNGYSQLLFEIDPVAGTVTETSLLNTSGDDLKGIAVPVWMGKDCIAFINGDYKSINASRDGRYVYSMKRTSGTWGAMQKTENPYGAIGEYDNNLGWTTPVRATKDGRAVVNGSILSGGYQYCDLMFDFALNKVWLMNSNSYTRDAQYEFKDAPMLSYFTAYDSNAQKYRIAVHRHQSYIATINNLASPVTKDGTKTMVIQYRFTFENVEE